MAKKLGLPFMGWQQLVADVGGEIDPDTGLPAYREVIVTVMRQSGKTSLVLAVECERCLLWGRPQRVAYTAQTGLDGRQKFTQDHWPLIERSPLHPLVDRPYFAADNTGLVWRNGSRISVLSTGKESGHGKTLDLAIIDEAFADEDDRREQALLPTMITRPDAQLWNVSTAGTQASTYLMRKVEIGRAAVEAGQTSGIAYFEWSIPEDEDIDSPDVWARYMPAFGITISEATIRHARATMSEGEFRRAFGNQWTAADNRVIPEVVWRTACQVVEAEESRSVLAVDATPEQGFAAIAAADVEGRCEVVDHRPGTGWLVARTAEVASRWRIPVVVDARGPASHVIPPLRALGVEVVEFNTTDYARACADFYQRVMDGEIRIRPHAALDAAAAGARRRNLGDAWVWARRDMSTDISPLVAVTLAAGRAMAPRSEVDPMTQIW